MSALMIILGGVTEVLLTLAAVVLAWVVFRLDRHAQRGRDIDESLGVLSAVWHGIVERRDNVAEPGWGQIYFAEPWCGDRLDERIEATRKMILENRQPDQIFVVPTESLERLADAGPSPGLIDEAVVSAAAWALWRVRVFNQLVGKMTVWNVRYGVEVADHGTLPERREALAEAAARISCELHAYGVGDGTTTTGGPWYETLKKAIRANMTRLDPPRKPPLRERYLAAGIHYVLGDVAVAAMVAATVIALSV
jgi:hypothetical protein